MADNEILDRSKKVSKKTKLGLSKMQDDEIKKLLVNIAKQLEC